MAFLPRDEHAPFEVPDVLPLLPIRDLVVFPYMIVPLFVSRDLSVAALEEAMARDRLIFLAAQRDGADDAPRPDAIHSMGTVGMIMRMRKLPDGRFKVLVQGMARARIESWLRESPALTVRVTGLRERAVPRGSVDLDSLLRSTRENLDRLVHVAKGLSPDIMMVTSGIHEPGRLADLIASNLSLKVEVAQSLLETLDPLERLQRVNEELRAQLATHQVQQQIQSQAREEMSRTQREYFLREQLRQIRAELGEGDGKAEEIEELRRRLDEAGLPAEARAEADKGLRRLESMHQDSAEAAVIRTHLDWLADLPWAKESQDTIDLRVAQEVLDEDHYGLQRVKDRLLEYLGVRKLKADMKGPILCLAGPPGVGKTSLGRSVARAMGRQFVRVSLGGVRDEAEVRGHRRTYVGAMPGRIVQAIKQAGTRNPVVLLDEIDKLGNDFRGDPAAALLEVLDPEQNAKFRDHYLGVDFDLSRVLFIATANLLDTIPGPLRDRMEVISIAGYTELDKLHICRRHVVPRQIEENGLTPEQIEFTDKALKGIIRGYTREAGLRNLERQVGAVCRKVARRVAEGREGKTTVTSKSLARYLGPARWVEDEALATDEVGVVTGLAWTQAGGEILRIEASAMKGRGGLILTGQLGDVMKESARAALTWVRSRAPDFGIDEAFFDDREIHIHVPAGAIPKDGPSAGIAMAVALVSLATGRPVRRDVAMTGEISLRGRAMPIGGLKEKLLAAMRSGVAEVAIPVENEKDLVEVPRLVKKRVRVVPVRAADEVIELALRPAGGARNATREKGKSKAGAGRGRRKPSAA